MPFAAYPCSTLQPKEHALRGKAMVHVSAGVKLAGRGISDDKIIDGGLCRSADYDQLGELGQNIRMELREVTHHSCISHYPGHVPNGENKVEMIRAVVLLNGFELTIKRRRLLLHQRDLAFAQPGNLFLR